jgi:hypothetical protein
VRVDAEDAAERNIGHVQVAGIVEYRPLEERVGGLTAAVGVGPVGPDAGAAQAVGHSREQLGLTDLGRLQEEHDVDPRIVSVASAVCYWRSNAVFAATLPQ